MFELTKRNSRPNMLRTLDLLGQDYDDFGKMIDNLFHFHGVPTTSGINYPLFSPSLNVVEKENEYEVSLELPGIEEENVEISINDDDILSISGEKKSEKTENNENYCVKECTYGNFKREIPLPHNIKKDDIDAKFKNGILTINIPKIEIEKDKKPKKIKIKKE